MFFSLSIVVFNLCAAQKQQQDTYSHRGKHTHAAKSNDERGDADDKLRLYICILHWGDEILLLLLVIACLSSSWPIQSLTSQVPARATSLPIFLNGHTHALQNTHALTRCSREQQTNNEEISPFLLRADRPTVNDVPTNDRDHSFPFLLLFFCISFYY